MELVGQLAGGIAHDFNNLLTAMIGFCDLLLLRHTPRDQSFADIQQIKQNANRAANLVHQLLAFSRQQTLQPKVLDMTDVLSETSYLLRRLIGADIELKFYHGRDLWLMKADQGQFEQVVINRAVNARDAMNGGVALTTRTSNVYAGDPRLRDYEGIPNTDYVLLEIQDDGTGIPDDVIGKIFEPFFTAKEVGAGTGLGLSTVYGIVKQTGGYVFADNVAGEGAKFSVYLPRFRDEEADVEVVAPVEPEEIRRDLTGVGTVMLVEGEDAVRLFGARALRNKDYSVVEAKDGEGALEVLNGVVDGMATTVDGEKIDLLITDVVMPGVDGPTLVREVRQRYPELKVIFISSYTEDTFRDKLGAGEEV
ncbi:MAG: ATP-binding protein [Alphaproteobacteria bacterium]|nr:ATP-binding protein [Alphaproteobacteria bacterium]